MSAVTIDKGPNKLAGLLYMGVQSSPTDIRPAVIIVHPGGGVKEQTASLYAGKLAEQGCTTLCYDASHQGESEGQPRYLEDPATRVRDIWHVVDYLQGQSYVDPERIAVLGICAGGGYAIAAAVADHRIKAVATISMVNIGDSARCGWTGDGVPEKQLAGLRECATQLTAEVTRGTEPVTAPYVQPETTEQTPLDLKEAVEYYLTPRAQHPRAVNKMLFVSLPRILTYDAFQLADAYLMQPVLLIAGQRAESLWHTLELDKLIKGRSRIVLYPEATHMDLLDKQPFVDQAAKEIAKFLNIGLWSKDRGV